MRNYDQKTKDMAESILPSTHRRGARQERRLIHRRERARVRAAIHRATIDDDFDDVDLRYEDRAAVREMVDSRREADKIGPLVRWASRKVEIDPGLRAEDWTGRMARFRRMFSNDTIGRHALSHIEWALGTPTWATSRWIAYSEAARAPRGARTNPLLAACERIVTAGAHGDLNRRIKLEIPRKAHCTVWTPRGSIVEERIRVRRLLHGAHDIEAFAREASLKEEGNIALRFAEELG